MAVVKYKCPPQGDIGSATFSDDIVGLQLVAGGGLTNANFEFSTNLVEKINREFNIGAFSDPISLNDLNISTIEESKRLVAKNLEVYPNFDLSEVTNFTLYGSLTKRISTSIQKIVRFFPGAIEVSSANTVFQTGITAYDISYNPVIDETVLKIPLNWIKNPFEIQYSVNATRDLLLSEVVVSPLRDLTVEFNKYSLFVNNGEYIVVDIEPTTETSKSLDIIVSGNPFNNDPLTYQTLVLRPNTLYTENSFNDYFDEVENFLLNRLVSPVYTSNFTYPIENEDGTYSFTQISLTWPTDGLWNLDIRTTDFESYLNSLNEITENLDSYQTNLISRFFVTDAFKEFDTSDRKVEKTLQIYGRSFDEIRKYIVGLANMNSVQYNTGNDIPSQLLKNLAQTLGWTTNISPITNTGLLQSIFGTTTTSQFTGLSRPLTPDELNFQFYKNIILNAAYLFRSKGTRRSIEILLRLIGAPEALVDFNEYVYIADQRINIKQFDGEFLNISGGLDVNTVPVVDPNNIYSIQGVQYTGFTLLTTVIPVLTRREDYPMDDLGYPQMPQVSESYFYQIGGGWFESTPQHRMPQFTTPTNQQFTGSNPNYQTQLLPFNYGEIYLERYRNFPYMNLGYKLERTIDNKKSWPADDVGYRTSSDAGFNAYYQVSDERYVLNVKNVDVFLNPSQGILFDVYTMSNQYNYPIPRQGLDYVEPTYCNPFPNGPYPNPEGIDWTRIDPKPQEKTFFEFAQTFWLNTINVRNRQFITDGKTGGYPTLQSIFWRYLESGTAINVPNNNFTYQTMIEYVNGLGDYWMKFVSQMIPATTLLQSGVRLENSIFHRQKFVWRRQRGCQLVPTPCNPCELNSQIFVFDCPIQQVTCPLYPWQTNPLVTSFGSLLGYILNQDGIVQPQCNYNTLQTSWFVKFILNGSELEQVNFYTGTGYFDVPGQTEYYNGLTTGLLNLQNEGFGYYINDSDETVTIYNNNCIPIGVSQNFKISVGINYSVLCNNI